METKYIFGHKNPDTDSICSAIVYGNFLKNIGEEIKICKLGELSNETKFILNEFGVIEPQTIETLPEKSKVILMDHNEKSQTIDGIENLTITEIIDHHKFKIETSNPLKIIAEPLGSTCTIIAKILLEKNYEISKQEASLLASGIISDTLYFRSPTTTPEDKKILEKLNEIAQIENLEKYSLEMFKAKSDLGNIDVEKLIRLDYKVFEFGGNKYGIGVMETTNPNYAIKRKNEIIAKMKEIKQKDNLKGIVFSIIDILNENNLTIYPEDYESELLKTIFNSENSDNIANLGSLISRKKQIAPAFEKHFN